MIMENLGEIIMAVGFVLVAIAAVISWITTRVDDKDVDEALDWT